MPPSSPGTRPGAPVPSRSEAAAAPRPGPSGPLAVRAGSNALRALLADLGARVRPGRGLAREVTGPPACCPTGIARLDARLGGGFPLGRLSELCGPPSSGRTSLAMTLLAETLARGALAAWIDPADAFDPASAAAALAAREGGEPDPGGAGGGEGDGRGNGALQRLLWVRARTEQEAVRCCERILQTEGFALTLVDLAHTREAASDAVRTAARSTARSGTRDPAPRAPGTGIRDASWLRLARLAARGRSALVVLSNAAQTGSRAELVLEMRRARARFTRPPALLDALETTAVLRRHRTRPAGQEVALSLDADPTVPSPILATPALSIPTPTHAAPRPDARRN